MSSELVCKWRNGNTADFTGEDSLLHGEESGRQRLYIGDFQFLAGLQSFPRGWHLDNKPRQVKAGVNDAA